MRMRIGFAKSACGCRLTGPVRLEAKRVEGDIDFVNSDLAKSVECSAVA